jgi:hypothetical protein
MPLVVKSETEKIVFCMGPHLPNKGGLEPVANVTFKKPKGNRSCPTLFGAYPPVIIFSTETSNHKKHMKKCRILAVPAPAYILLGHNNIIEKRVGQCCTQDLYKIYSNIYIVFSSSSTV